MSKRKAGRLALIAALFSAVALPATVLPAAAGVTGSHHDFTGRSFAPGGACSACHREHFASSAPALWPRDLADEISFFAQDNNPDYVPGGTLLCYDCHVDYLTSGSGATPDNDPSDLDWASNEEPQDIAFTDGSGPEVGYYELKDGTVPGAPPPPGSPTGGHYWKSEPSGTPDYAIGDKIHCGLCHDPHDEKTGSNEAMFRTSTPNGSGGTVDLGNGHTASANSRNGSGDGREMCAACHGFSDVGAPVVLWGVTLPAPTASIADHRRTASGDCTDCHRHNYITPAGCNDCHSHPGLDTATAEWTLSGVHNMHVGDPLPSTDGNYGFACTACHYGYDHNESSVSTADWGNFDAALVDIRFDAALNPGTPTYNGSAAGQGVAVSAPGNGGTGQCAGLACHGNNPTLQSDWSGAIETPNWALADPARLACDSCHNDPPASGAHGLHTVDNGGGGTNRTDCERCHTAMSGYEAVPPAPATFTVHVNGVTEAAGAAYTGETVAIPPNGYCTLACHGSSAIDGRWDDTVLNCDACHYINLVGDATGIGNDTSFRSLSNPGHNGHFDAAGRTFSCLDCHPDNSGDLSTGPAGLTHFTDNVGTDLQVIEGRSIPLQTDATIIDTPWITVVTEWNDVTSSCTVSCHDPSAAGTFSAAWGTANASCEFCHYDGTTQAPGTGAHGAHWLASGLYGKIVACTDCHVDNLLDYGHMTGTVDLSPLAPLIYGGTPERPYGDNFATATCDTATCHQDGKGTAVVSPAWSAVVADPACDLCHASPPNAGNDGARHVTHDGSTFYVDNACGSCHAANASKTDMTLQPAHIDGIVDGGGVYNMAYLVAGGCTSDCHEVDPAAAGDWIDVDPLDCVHCHAPGFIGAEPATGLHSFTAAEAHDGSFPESAPLYGCSDCHNSPPSAAPGGLHLDGTVDDSTASTYSFNAAIIDYDNTTGWPGWSGCQATCHTDGGDWWRRWEGSFDAVPADGDSPGDAVCANCHGDWTNGWNWDEANATTVDHTDPYAGNSPTDAMGAAGQHPDCDICHGWGDAANYNRDWLGGSDINYVGHGDGHITMNGPDEVIGPFNPAGSEYDDDTGGCARACHLPAFVLNSDSGWIENYGDFGGGVCESCHHSGGPGPNVMGDGSDPVGTGLVPKPFDDGTWGFNVNGHGANGTASDTPGGFDPDSACTDCHDTSDPAGGAGAHDNGTLNSAEQGLNPSTNTAHLIGAYINSFPSNDYDVQLTFDGACRSLCHSTSGVPDMRHTRSNPVTNVMEFGRMSTTPDGESIAWPIDVDVTTYASGGGSPPDVDYGLCVSCHNPHGTDVDESSKATNRMVREHWISSPTLFCGVCHF